MNIEIRMLQDILSSSSIFDKGTTVLHQLGYNERKNCDASIFHEKKIHKVWKRRFKILTQKSYTIISTITLVHNKKKNFFKYFCLDNFLFNLVFLWYLRFTFLLPSVIIIINSQFSWYLKITSSKTIKKKTKW